MGATYELICHHTYSGLGGLPADVSGCGNHGRAADTGFLADGVAPNSGAVRFPHAQSRIRVPTAQATNKYWRRLGGIKVEAAIRMRTQTGVVRTIVAGDNAFMFFVHGTGVLYGSYIGPVFDPTSYGDGINSADDAPDGTTHLVPPGVWVQVAFLHDGLDRMELQIDGRTVARRTDVTAAVPGVGPLGVSIGNAVNGHPVLDGDIDEIKISRLDPTLVDTLFFARPVDKKVADCWETFLSGIADGLARNPDCAKLIDGVVRDVLDQALRTLAQKKPSPKSAIEGILREYLRLWRAGELHGREMAKVLDEWCALLRQAGISFKDDPAVQALVASGCLAQVLSDNTLDCDAEFIAFVKLIGHHCQ